MSTPPIISRTLLNKKVQFKNKAGELSKRYKGQGAVSFSTWVTLGILCSMSISTDLHLLSDIKASEINDIIVMATSVISIIISLLYLAGKYHKGIIILMLIITLSKIGVLIHTSMINNNNNNNKEIRISNLWASLIFNLMVFIILVLSVRWGKWTRFELKI